jgi:hypothetical protein
LLSEGGQQDVGGINGTVPATRKDLSSGGATKSKVSLCKRGQLNKGLNEEGATQVRIIRVIGQRKVLGLHVEE